MSQRIALISSSYPQARPGGVPTYVDARATHLARRAQVQVFALGGAEIPATRGQVRQVVLGAPESFRRDCMAVWWRLIIQLWRFRPSHVEIHNIPVGLPIFLLWRAAYFFHGPAVAEARFEGGTRWSLFLRRCTEWLAVATSCRLYVVSHSFRQLLLAEYPNSTRRKRVLVRYPRLPLQLGHASKAQTDADAKLAPQGLVLVCVRRQVKRTGVALLIEVFCDAVQAGELPAGTVLHVVGDGPEQDRIRALVESHACGRSVRLRGRLPDAERTQLFQAADWQVVPTLALEGFGLVVVEAALQGCPSLITRVGALPEVLSLLDDMGHQCEPDAPSIRAELVQLKPWPESRRKRLAYVASRRFELKSS